MIDQCPDCGLSLNWISHIPELDCILRLRENTDGNWGSGNLLAPDHTSDSFKIGLNRGLLTRLGRDSKIDNALADSSIELCHVLIASWKDPQKSSGIYRYFLVDCNTKIGTWVNRQRILAKELQAGDFLQIGPFAWNFSKADGRLIPLPPIAGLGIELKKAHIHRLGPDFNLQIQPGEFVAIVGPSGAGKSTLIKVLAGVVNLKQPGMVLLRESNGKEWDRAKQNDEFRQALGYVSQESILHEELSSRQILSASAQLRGRPVEGAQLEAVLLRMELEPSQWDRPLHTLSGGENKRLRTANELMGIPRLLLLDEPDSGLDQNRRELLLRLLRTLSWQGCTVVMITHGVADLKQWCDRIVKIDQGKIAHDEPANLDRNVPTRIPPSRIPVNWWQQTIVLVQREWDRIQADRKRRLLLPMLIACLFAGAVGLAVPRDESALLGFLSIISVLWMSASLSLLEITGEREVFDHERLLFLSIPSYLLAKTATLLVCSMGQTAVYYLALLEIRHALGRSWYYSPLMVFLILVLVGFTGIALGLCLSSWAGRKKEIASYVLPLIMVAQIVFSIPVVEHGKVNNSVGDAYGEFNLQNCQKCHHKYATAWKKELNWLCDDCRKKSQNKMPQNQHRQPFRFAACASYLTISRPADIALRILAYDDPRDAQASSGWSPYWASAQIFCWMIGLLGVTAADLMYHTRIHEFLSLAHRNKENHFC